MDTYQAKRFTLMVLFMSSLMLSACDQNSDENQGPHIPGVGFKPDVQKGEQLYSQSCSKCHGVNALGTDKGPPLVDETYRPGHHGDMVFHFAVSKGAKQHHWHYGDMPAIPELSPEEVGHITGYVRQEQRKAGIR